MSSSTFSFTASGTDTEYEEASYSNSTSRSLSYDDTLSDRTSDNFNNSGSSKHDGESLFSANVSSDEDDSFIDDDDDVQSSPSILTKQLNALEPTYPPTLLFDKPNSITVFLTEYQEKAENPSQLQSTSSSLECKLLEAAEQGDLDTVIATLKSGANVECVDKNGRTVMHIACSLGHIDMVKHLIELGVSVDAFSQKNKQTPLHEACIGGHMKILQLLLSEVADLDVVDHSGRSAAHYCAIHGESNCLGFLCSQGCDICLEDSMNRTGVHFAAMNDHCDVIQILMERGADLDVGDKEGKTPVHYAARYGSVNALEALLKNAVDIYQGDAGGSLPTHEAAYYDKLQCLKVLIKKGVKCSLQDDGGRNILHKAAQGKSLSTLHWILSSGKVDANSQDFSENTGLHYSAANGFSEGFSCLLQHGASPSACDVDKRTPFEVARKHGKWNSIKKAVDGHCTCRLCGSVVTKPKHRQNSTVLSGGRGALFKLPDSVRIQSTSAGVTTSKNNSVLLRKKSSIVETSSSHFTLAAKYYGPPV